MSLLQRIKQAEKQVIPETKRGIIPLLTTAWRVGDKVFYFDLMGQAREYIEKDHYEHPIFNFMPIEAEARFTIGATPHN